MDIASVAASVALRPKRSLEHVHSPFDPRFQAAPLVGLAGRRRASGERPQMDTHRVRDPPGLLPMGGYTGGQSTHEPRHACLRERSDAGTWGLQTKRGAGARADASDV